MGKRWVVNGDEVGSEWGGGGWRMGRRWVVNGEEGW